MIKQNLVLTAVVLFVMTFLVQPASAAVVLFNQGFEVDTDGWIDFGGGMTRVPSGGGTLSVPSADGGFHAEVTTTSSGNFTRFGEYGYTWPGFIIQSLDIYIDPAAGSIGDGWFLDNAVNDNINNNDGVTAGSDWREAGGVGALKATDGFWWIAADGDGSAYPGLPAGGVGLQITTAGWYTIESQWVENGDGLTVDRDTYIYDSNGSVLYSNLNPQQVPLTVNFPIGGNRYGWLSRSEGNSIPLAIDNSVLTVGVPEPATISMLLISGICGLFFAARRKLLKK